MTRASRKAADPHERRAQPRRRSISTAWIAATGYGTARCKVVNLADEGAQITGPIGLRIGDRLTLSLNTDIKHRARVIWVEADIIGINFVTD